MENEEKSKEEIVKELEAGQCELYYLMRKYDGWSDRVMEAVVGFRL